MNKDLVFLKLGGSLITQKNEPRTPRLATLERLANEIAAASAGAPQLQLVIGHGSGSYGHMAGKKYGTRQGVATPQQWRGFVEVWQDARALNEIVLHALQSAGLPVMAFPVSSAAYAQDGKITSWNLAAFKQAIAHGIVPLVFGDVAFDTLRGGTILSTEDIFYYLALHLQPGRILLAGIEPGVWADFPACTRLLTNITGRDYNNVSENVGGSSAVDVTGGMQQKVNSMLELAVQIEGLEALIFSGEQPGLLEQAIQGGEPGTLIQA